MSTLLGQGAFTIREVSHILGRKRAWVMSWLRTFSKTRQNSAYETMLIDQVQVLSFADFIELYLMSEFERQNIKRSKIRKAAEELVHRYSDANPFSLKSCFTDCIDIFIEYDQEGTILNEDASSRRGQLVLAQLLDIKKRVEFRVEYDADGRACRFWPQAKSNAQKGRIVMDPQRQLGRPIDVASGVATQVLYLAYVAEGPEHIDLVARSYRVSKESVLKAVEFESALLAA